MKYTKANTSRNIGQVYDTFAAYDDENELVEIRVVCRGEVTGTITTDYEGLMTTVGYINHRRANKVPVVEDATKKTNNEKEAN